MTDEELIAWLRDLAAVLGKEVFKRAADRIEALSISNATLIAERDQWIAHAKNAIWSDSEQLRLAEAELAENEVRLGKAVEALEALIQLAHDCEKELTEDLHHMDFCGESEPLTKARATLAKIKSHSDEFATQKGETHE